MLVELADTLFVIQVEHLKRGFIMTESFIVLMLLIGLFSGIASGIFGIGGGVIIVPVYRYPV